ncbi:MAG: PQQ-binding-like beta-propeller repeat protein, partial [Planctomycetota bacterium]|jgi:outer membrane protein assembly factor BamB
MFHADLLLKNLITSSSATHWGWLEVSFYRNLTMGGTFPSQAWSVNFLCQGRNASTWSAPVIQGNRLVIAGRDKTSDLFFCLNTESGELIWKSAVKSKNKTSYGPGPRATPAIAEGKVYTLGRGGEVTCWQLLDGKQVWQVDLDSLGGEPHTWGYASSPLVRNGRVYLFAGGTSTALALDAETGKTVWRSGTDKVGYASPIWDHHGGKDELLVFHGMGLSGYDPESGAIRWTTPFETSFGCNITAPLRVEDALFICAAYGMGSQLVRPKGQGAEVIWKQEAFGPQHSDPVLIDGFIYGYSGDSAQNKGEYLCLDAKTGAVRWRTSEMGWGSQVRVGDHLICLDVKGNLFLHRPNGKAFDLVASMPKAIPDVNQYAWTAPVVAQDHLFLRYRQTLISYRLSE